MTDIDRLYRKIKDRWRIRRTQVDASAKELTFLVELLDMMEDDEFGKDDNAPCSGWISVKDRLPEVGNSYIVAGKQRYPGEPWEYFTDVAVFQGSYIDDFWDTFNDWDEGQEIHITHWMPLPEPPKEDAT